MKKFGKINILYNMKIKFKFQLLYLLQFIIIGAFFLLHIKYRSAKNAEVYCKDPKNETIKVGENLLEEDQVWSRKKLRRQTRNGKEEEVSEIRKRLKGYS